MNSLEWNYCAQARHMTLENIQEGHSKKIIVVSDEQSFDFFGISETVVRHQTVAQPDTL